MEGTPPRIAVIGLGYVGLPLAVALAAHFPTVGFDVDPRRIAELRAGQDRTREVSADRLAAAPLVLADDSEAARGADIFIVTVPTPVDAANRPDLAPICAATRTVGGLIERGRDTIVVYESTVYPGLTEEVCGPELERVSGLVRGRDFHLGYSPERINPGDRVHAVDRIVKVVAGETPAVTARLSAIYGAVTTAGTYAAASIRTAEAAKVIENAQRDINIAFMNEITQIFEKLGLSIWDVLDAASTKWNFLPFQPGLVGGHCIGVDPYYLSHCAQSVGHLPRAILAGRAINDGMGGWIADRIHEARGSRAGSVLLLGLTFKEDVPDLRNSKSLDLARRLRWLGHTVTLHDPLADRVDAAALFDMPVVRDPRAVRSDVVLPAVAHAHYRAFDADAVAAMVAPGGLVADLRGIWRHLDLPAAIHRWTL